MSAAVGAKAGIGGADDDPGEGRLEAQQPERRAAPPAPLERSRAEDARHDDDEHRVDDAHGDQPRRRPHGARRDEPERRTAACWRR